MCPFKDTTCLYVSKGLVCHAFSFIEMLNIAKLLRGKYLRGEMHAQENRGGREKGDTLLNVRHDFPHVTSGNIKYSCCRVTCVPM